MNFYHQIHSSDHINRFYGDVPSGSGFSTLPYNWGWINKYSPKPFGLPINAYSHALASIGYAPNVSGYAMAMQSNTLLYNAGTMAQAVYGPINAVYELQFSGIAEDLVSPGRCISCSGLNIIRLVHPEYHVIYPNERLGQNIGVDSVDQPRWMNQWCSTNSGPNLCDNAQITYLLGASGIIGDTAFVRLECQMINSHGWAYKFKKEFGRINTADPMQDHLKPLMLEGEHILTYDVNSVNNSGEYGCDFTNAVVIARPYKSGFYDVPNVLKHFSSGNNYFQDLNYTTSAFEVYSTACEEFNRFDAGYTVTSSGSRNFMPYFWNLSLPNSSGLENTSACIGCSGYYGGQFKLSYDLIEDSDNEELTSMTITYPSNGASVSQRIRTFYWSGVNIYRKLKPATTTYTNVNFHNICDFGCNELSNAGNGVLSDVTLLYDTRGASLSRSGPCNNMIQMDIVDNISGVNSTTWMDAYIYFGGAYADTDGSAAINKYISGQAFHKTICDDRTSNRCTKSSTVGNLSCFSPAPWSSGWSLVDINSLGLASKPTVLASGLDITNSCNFSNVQPIITPFLPNAPCFGIGCRICSDYGLPQTADVSLTTSSGVFNWAIPINSAKGCQWGEAADILNVTNWLAFGGTLTLTKPVVYSASTIDGYIVYNIYWTSASVNTVSGIKMGGNLNKWLDCGTTLTGAGNTLDFTDIIDTRTYLSGL